MSRVFVNGISAKSGGGKSVLINFLKIAHDSEDSFRYLVAVPDLHSYAHLSSERIQFVALGALSGTSMIPLASAVLLPAIALRGACDVVLNFADVPMRTSLPQVFLFDWPYAAFPESPAWRLSTAGDRIVRGAKMQFFKWLLPNVDIMIAQNGVIGERLRRHYGFKQLEIVPNAVSIENIDGGDERDFALGSQYNLLCLSRYYSHKNIEIFIPIAEMIRAKGERIKIITTISPSDGAGARRFLADLKDRKLENIIMNLGTVEMRHVPSLYRQVDALLLPTLLESFSGTYVEAMFHGKPILTSDLPFAEAVCGDSAYYFDPHDETQIFDRIIEVRNDENKRRTKLSTARELLDKMPSWRDAYSMYTDIISSAVCKCEKRRPLIS